MKLKSGMTFFLFAMLGLIINLMNGCGDFKAAGVRTSNSSLESQLFSKVQGILATNCLSCHATGGSAVNFDLSTPEAFISAGLISPGKPAQSKLIYRLKNYLSTSNNNNMPSNGLTLADEDFQTIYNWIVDMSSETSPFVCTNNDFDINELQSNDAKRLSIRQYKNTIVDLLTLGSDNTYAIQVSNDAIATTYLPNDSSAQFSREDNSFTGNHSQAFFSIADFIANSFTNQRVDTFVKQYINLDPSFCPTPNLTNLSKVCLSQFVKNFTSRAFRRPIREVGQNIRDASGNVVDELTPLVEEFNGLSLQQGLNRLIFRVLLSPHFLFQIEDQDLVLPLPQNANVYRLSSYAIASRLAYRFWNSMPDSQLWQLAKTTDLYEDDNFSVALNYVLTKQSKLDDALKEYWNNWLQLEKTPNFNPSPRFSLINSSVNFNTSLRTAMINEIEDLGSFVTQSGGSFTDLFLSDVSVTRNSDLMKLYGLTQAAPSTITKSNAIHFPSQQRAGILTRSALLISGSEIPNLIIRGAHIRKNILCLDLGAPPANALSVFDSTQVPHILSTRDKVDIKTSGSSCVGCHSLINPIGFGLAQYDAFGSFMTNEPIFSETSNSIDTYVNVSANVDLSDLFGAGARANGSRELSQFIVDQQSTKSCFSQKFMSYTYNRKVDAEKDACRLGKIYTNLESDGRLIDMIRASAMDLEFRLRKMD
jgi:hypothetical protein